MEVTAEAGRGLSQGDAGAPVEEAEGLQVAGGAWHCHHNPLRREFANLDVEGLKQSAAGE